MRGAHRVQPRAQPNRVGESRLSSGAVSAGVTRQASGASPRPDEACFET